jgi:hypothetical protein
VISGVGPRPVGLPRGFGRIPVAKVSPVIEGGAYPAKAVVGELIPIRAKVFREGHDAVNASVILTAPDGTTRRVDMRQVQPAGLDPWEAWVRPDAEGAWTFRVEGWSDPWATWLHNAEAKLPAGVDIELVCLEGRDLLERAAVTADQDGDPVEASILRATAMLLIPQRPASELLEVATGQGLDAAMRKFGPRELVSPTADFPLWVDRARALFSSWYEFFPRSQGAWYDHEAKEWHSGTFDNSHGRLEAAAAMGFDVIYLPPIHPIGAAFRKGRNNTLIPGPGDPGSPWAIGGAAGGHDTLHPDLGDWDAFDRLVAKAKELGVELALDFALQASPDHPWVQDHPEWFTTRLDGTIAYAENPPKKYQDIYPINFDNDRDGIYAEVLRVLRLWMSHGVRIFRVDNPHTKPVEFWAWLMAEVRRTDPDVIFLAEAFTRPEMMHALGKVGYHQSYTYYTWRHADRLVLPSELLREHPRHQPVLPAVGQPGRVRDPGDPCRHAVADLGGVLRLRTVRARAAASRRRGVPELREVRVPAARLPRRAEPQRAAGPAERDPPPPPRPAAVAAAVVPPRPARQGDRLLQDRRRRHRHRGVQPRPRSRRGDRAAARLRRPRGARGGVDPGAGRAHRGGVQLGPEQLRPAHPAEPGPRAARPRPWLSRRLRPRPAGRPGWRAPGGSPARAAAG